MAVTPHKNTDDKYAPQAQSKHVKGNDKERLHSAGEVAGKPSETISSQQRLLEQANQLMHQGRLAAIGEMAAGIAHEINQPLSIINVTADGMVNYLSEPQDDKERELLLVSAKKILVQARRAASIIEGMHSFLRANAAPMAALDLKEPLMLAASFFEAGFDQQGILFEVDLADDVPLVTGNHQKISQIVTNLLGNARLSVLEKFKDSGDGRQKKIRLSLVFDPETKMALFEVQDNGMGMGKETLDHCLEAFYTTRDEGVGTGLGLFMVREIANEFGMKMEVESVEGKGATFGFSMPVIKTNQGE